MTAEVFHCMALGGDLLEVHGLPYPSQQSSRTVLLLATPDASSMYIDYKSEAALMQQSSVVAEGSLESLADPFSLCSQRNAVSCDGCGTCVQSCRSVSPRRSVLCQEGDAIPLNHCQTGNFSHFESSKLAITIVSRNRLKAAVEENKTLRMAVIFERPRTGHFSVLFLFVWIPSTTDRCR